MRVAVVGNGQLAGALVEAVAEHHTVGPIGVADVVWLAADTPVSPSGHGDVAAVRAVIEPHWQSLRDGAVVLVSSQVPVGFTCDLRYRFRVARPQPTVGFAYCVENIRANTGRAGWDAQSAFVCGHFGDRWVCDTLWHLLKPWNKPLLLMSTASAEFAKCAINGLLATVIGYVNEIGELAKAVGAEPGDVERALRTDVRLGQAPVTPGRPFNNEHLGRDLRYLQQVAVKTQHGAPVLSAVRDENNRRLQEEVKDGS